MEEFVIYVEPSENWGPEASLDTSRKLDIAYVVHWKSYVYFTACFTFPIQVKYLIT